jgi:release factor glutamine methyltransferase
MRLCEHTASARNRLVLAGIDGREAALDAELLARELLGWDRAAFLARCHEEPPASFADRFGIVIARRERREPVAYIIGHREFYGLDFEVGPDVLVPRPESELIVEEALACAETAASSNGIQGESAATLRVADVGTGSGCLAVSLALALRSARVIATDISSAALRVARRNATRHGVLDRVQFVRTNLLSGLSPVCDLIVCNPPYVPTGATSVLPPEVLQYEPTEALMAGADGLDIVRRLAAEAAAHLAPGGWLIFEFGHGQEPGVRETVSGQPGLSLVRIRRDLQGIPRTAVVRRTPTRTAREE